MNDTLMIRPFFLKGLIEAMRLRFMFDDGIHTEEKFLSQMVNPASYDSGVFKWSVSEHSILSLHNSNGRINSAVFSDLPKSPYAS